MKILLLIPLFIAMAACSKYEAKSVNNPSATIPTNDGVSSPQADPSNGSQGENSEVSSPIDNHDSDVVQNPPVTPIDQVPVQSPNYQLKPVDWDLKLQKVGPWTDYVYHRIDEISVPMVESIPDDVTSFCPNYKNLSYEQTKNFWVYLLSAMSRFESNHNPTLSYKEAFNDAHGNPVISRGLLQISKESANGYKCNIKDEQELHDPYINLSCGLLIIQKWVTTDKVISGKVSGKWRGGARYWAVLRTPSILNQIKTLSQGFCKKLE